MCIAILNSKAGGLISKETLNTCWQGNKDGAGMMWAINDRLHIFKELKKFKKFYAEYEKVRTENPDIPIVLHFRWATHGLKDMDNCHPYLVHENLGFVHNGIITGVAHSKTKSDTAIFNEVILQKLPKNFVRYEGNRRLIRRFIGDSNKLIFMNNKSRWRIINEEAGVWDNYNWFSNRGYKSHSSTCYKGTGCYSNYDYSVSSFDKNETVDFEERYQWNSQKGHYELKPEWVGRGSTYYGGTQSKSKIVKPAGIVPPATVVTPPTLFKNINSSTEFDERGLPLGMKTEIRKEESKEWAEVKGQETYNDFHQACNDFDNKGRPKTEYCSECYSPLKGKMEQYYGACTKCLVEVGLLDAKQAETMREVEDKIK